MKGGTVEAKIKQARELLSALESENWGTVEGIKFFRIQESLIEVKKQKSIEC